MKTYDVKLERTVTETATIKVEAKDKRSAAFAVGGMAINWTDAKSSATTQHIVAIDVAPQPMLAVDPPGNVESIAPAKKAKAG